MIWLLITIPFLVFAVTFVWCWLKGYRGGWE
jgi:hypothetical protein